MAEFSQRTNFAKPKLDKLSEFMALMRDNSSNELIPIEMYFHYHLLCAYAEICERYLFQSLVKLVFVMDKLEDCDFFEKDKDFDSVMAELGEAIHEAETIYSYVAYDESDDKDSASRRLFALQNLVRPFFGQYVHSVLKFGRTTAPSGDLETFVKLVNKQHIERLKKEFTRINTSNWGQEGLRVKADILDSYKKLTDDTNVPRSYFNEYLKLRTMVRKPSWKPKGVNCLDKSSSLPGVNLIVTYTRGGIQKPFRSPVRKQLVEFNSFVKRYVQTYYY
jgi:hypothetical protein